MPTAERCAYLLPWWSVGLGIHQEDDLPECDLPDGHDGPHEFTNPKGERMAWETMYCDGCDTPDDYCGCYTFWQTETKS